MTTIIDRCRNYISKIHSIAGQNGRSDCLKAASAIHGFDLDDETGMSVFREWNGTNATPQWSESDLLHKMREARKWKPAGFLLANDKPTYGPPTVPMSNQAKPQTEAEQKATRRNQWPVFRMGTDKELRSLASLRNISPGVCWIAQKEGFLRFADIDGEVHFVLMEGTLAQIRRLNGQPFTRKDGTTFKSKNLSGSVGKWLGYSFLRKHPKAPVVISEGLISWLEVAEAIDRTDHENWIPFASLSASVHLEGEELDLLEGREIIIARDRGEAGADAAVGWKYTLAEIGINARIWTPPDGANDIGEALTIPGFEPKFHFRKGELP